MSSRRDFLKGAAAASAATLIPTLAAGDGVALMSTAHPVTLGTIEDVRVTHAVVFPETGERWVTQAALDRGEWGNVSYIVKARTWDGEPMALISWQRPQPLQRSLVPIKAEGKAVRYDS